jgi:hypothetical protein
MLGLFALSGVISAVIGIAALVFFIIFLIKKSYILTTIMFVLIFPFFYWTYFVFDLLSNYKPY